MEDVVKNQFVFYSKLVRAMVLNLPESRDRILAVAWIRKLSDENVGDERLRTKYLKVLLFCLQRRKLLGIFADDPLSYKVLEDVAPDIDHNEFARNLLKQEQQNRREMTCQNTKEDMVVFPHFTTDCSPDLTEYVAVQDIPNFGVHAYYAISKQPVHKWKCSELAIFPKGTKSALGISTTTIKDSVARKNSAPIVEKEPDTSSLIEPPSQEKRKRRPRKLGSFPPTRPIGQVKRPAVERLTPTWGSNLVDIRERTNIGRIKETSEAAKVLEAAVSQKMKDQETEEERNERTVSREAGHKSPASKPQGMTYIITKFQNGIMDEDKIQPLSKFAKLRNRRNLNDPKTPKEYRIEVKSTKKKGKISKNIGSRSANISEEIDDSIKRILEEAGLTWQRLVSQEDNINEELQQIEDKVLVEGNGEELQIEDLELEGYEEIDYNGFLRETEADLIAANTIYDDGVEEDEKLIEWLQDRIEEVEEQQDIFREVEKVRKTSPAISRAIPITIPQSVASPRRVKSHEKIYAEETDHLLTQRQSPSYPVKNSKRHIPIDRKPKRPQEPISKVLNSLNVFEKVQKVANTASQQYTTEDDWNELAKSEREFQQELSERRRNFSSRPSSDTCSTKLKRMRAPIYRKVGDIDKVVLKTNEKTVGGQYGMETPNAVHRNLFGSCREITEVPELIGAKRRNMHGLRYWEQEPELMQELQKHPIDFLGVTENFMSSHQKEERICDRDFSQFIQKTPQMYMEENVEEHRESPQMRTPCPLQREAHCPSHEHPCMSCGSPQELDKFGQSQREIDQLSQFLPELEAQIQEARLAAWRDIEAMVMELCPTSVNTEDEAENVNTQLSGAITPQIVHLTRTSSEGLYSPGYVVLREPYEIEEDNEYLTQAMQTGQGAMLDDSHMYEFLGGYQISGSLSSQIIKRCGMTHRPVDEMMFHMKNDQSTDSETLVDYDSPDTYCTPPSRHVKAMINTDERRNIQEEFRHSSQQGPKGYQERCSVTKRPQVSTLNNGSQSLSKIAEKTRSI